MSDKDIMEGPQGSTKFLPKGLVILHEDNDILVINKPTGLLTMGTDAEKTRTAFYALNNYVRKGTLKSKKRVYIVHRLDRDTSGVIVFAKTEKAKQTLQEGWQETKKRYLAIVHGRCEKQQDILSSYLAENTAHKVYSTHDAKKGKPARTAYRVLQELKDFSLLEVDLLTGRKHQIRVHLAEIGHPVVGDKKYGRSDDPWKYLALHAFSLTLRHPFNGREMTFQHEPPGHFRSLLGGVVFNDLPQGASDHSGSIPYK
jgi:23S rRNA pseudouridine1911/1915/1917 synthase